jgi:hypothetical protein
MQESSSPPRRGIALALVVLAAVLAFGAIFAVWINRQVLNTDNWTTASSQLLERPVIRNQTAAFLTDELYANVDVEGEIRAALPARAQPLAGPAASFLRGRVERRARQALALPKVQELWEDANRAAHEQLMTILEGGGPVVSTQGGTVVLDLKALLEETERRAGFGGRAAGALPADAAQITVMRSDQLDTAQKVAKALKALPIVLVVLSLALFGLAVALAPGWRRRAVRAYGIGFVAAGAAALAAENLAGDALVDSLARTAAGEPAVPAVWDVYTPLLEQAAVATIGYGIVMVAGAWLAGPTRWALAVRRALAPYMREPVIVYSVVAVIVAAVVVWWAPTPALRNPITAIVLVLLFVAGVEGLRRQTMREFPDASREEAAARWRERVAGASGFVAAKARGGSTAVVRQASRFAPGAGPTNEDVRLAQLERLAQLRTDGVLDDEELRAEKARILADADGDGDDAPSTAPAKAPGA